jgi:hypothetical protein
VQFREKGVAGMTEFVFDTSGRVQQPSPEALAQADEDLAILGFVHGAMEDGRPYYAYVAIKPSQFREFHALTTAKKAMVIGEYGTVIAAGFEFEPPPEVVQEMRDVYGFDDQYEAKLKREAIRQQAAFFANQEKARIDDIVAMLKKQSTGSS